MTVIKLPATAEPWLRRMVETGFLTDNGDGSYTMTEGGLHAVMRAADRPDMSLIAQSLRERIAALEAQGDKSYRIPALKIELENASRRGDG